MAEKYQDIENREHHRIASAAIIHKDRRFLIVRRSLDKKEWPGRWAIPGGGLEINDYINTPPTAGNIWYFVLENSLRREIKEEVSLEIGATFYLLDLAFIQPDNSPVLALIFYAKWESGEVKLNSESIGHEWITAEEARRYDLVEGIPEAIQMVDAILCGKDPSTVKF